MRRLNTFIPLPELEHHTDIVQVESLGLPVGFDQERLGFNVVAIEHAMKWGGVSKLDVRAREGEQRAVNVDFDGINNDGTSNATGRVSTAKVALQHTTTHQVTDTTEGPFTKMNYDQSEGSVVINSSEKDARILAKSKRWPRGPFDPKAQAHFIDESVHDGLRQAIINQHTEPTKLVASLSLYGLASVLTAAGIQNISQCERGLLLGAMFNLGHAVYENNLHGRQYLDRQWSFFYGLPFDRHVAARFHVGRNLVKAINP